MKSKIDLLQAEINSMKSFMEYGAYGKRELQDLASKERELEYISDSSNLESFIDKHYEEIYTRYAEMYPEEIHSDWMLEDAEYLDDFIEDYMYEEFIEEMR